VAAPRFEPRCRASCLSLVIGFSGCVAFRAEIAFDSLSDVSPVSRHWSICVRIARMWDYCGTRDGQPPIHVDLVLVDEKGNHMYAEIPGNEATKFKQLVQEHKVYCFKKFLVAPSKAAYKPFPGKYMIKFTPWTSVTPVDDITPDFPLYVYNLMPFSELPSRVGHKTILLM